MGQRRGALGNPAFQFGRKGRLCLTGGNKLGDVLLRADDALRLAILPEKDFGAHVHPSYRTIRTANAELGGVGATRLVDALGFQLHPVEVIWVNEREKPRLREMGLAG